MRSAMNEYRGEALLGQHVQVAFVLFRRAEHAGIRALLRVDVVTP